MVSTVIFGGLGNQMFVYASSRAMALRLHTDLAMNIKQGFIDDILYHRHYELDAFNIQFQQGGIATFDIPCAKLIRKISRILGFNILCPTYKFFKEKRDSPGIDSRLFLSNHKNVFLEGYWINPRYFEDYADIIRQDFTLKNPVAHHVLAEENEIFADSQSTPISVGVRRYQECSEAVKNTMAKTDEDYYIKSMGKIAAEVKNPVFWVFSQDQQWFKDNVESKVNYKVRYVKQANKGAIDDLYLMTKFQYHIISNSTFYWWGAWLACSNLVCLPESYRSLKCASEKWQVI